MHVDVLDWVSYSLTQWDNKSKDLNIIEFGSLDINGSVRSILEPLAKSYIGVDVQSGPGVDIVADAAAYSSPEPADMVVCCEVFEHTAVWRDIIYNSYRLLKHGGIFIATAAGEGRHPHSAIDESPIREWEYYANIGSWEMGRAMRLFKHRVVNVHGADIRTFGIK